jgi:hypothetical protein
VSVGGNQNETAVSENAGLDVRGLFRRPSAFAPPIFSLAAFVLVTAHIAIYGVARQPDEGTAAHLWQLLMGAQVPVVGFFLAKWLPRAPRPALRILVLQVAAAVAALAPVYFLHL